MKNELLKSHYADIMANYELRHVLTTDKYDELEHGFIKNAVDKIRNKRAIKKTGYPIAAIAFKNAKPGDTITFTDVDGTVVKCKYVKRDGIYAIISTLDGKGAAFVEAFE